MPTDTLKATMENTALRQTNWIDDLPGLHDDEPASLTAAIETLRAAPDQHRSDNDNLCHWVDELITQIDKRLQAQMDSILHHPDFQALESSWRGLIYLLDHIDGQPDIHVRVLDINKQTLLEDFRCATDFDQSLLFRLVYEDEYGSFGGSPYTALILDECFNNSPDDLQWLEHITRVGAAAHAPVIAAPGPAFFGVRHFSQLTQVQRISDLLDTPNHFRWHQLRASDDARYLGLVLPALLGRMPYHPGYGRVDAFAYDESIGHATGSDCLWINAAYAYAGNLIAAFSQYGWLAAIRGVEGGGVVKQLPIFTFRSPQGDLRMHCPVQVGLTDRLEKQLSDQGFMGLVYCRHTDYAAFFSGQSAHQARSFHQNDANANARLSSQLPYVFAISRIAHYLKAIVRDKIGSFNSAASVQTYLNRWLSHYVLLDDHASQEAKARFPLREAQVEVSPSPDHPGQFKATVFLRPHFQLDDLSVSLRLVTELPQALR